MRASLRILAGTWLLILVVIGCSLPTEPLSAGVVVQNVAGEVVIMNRRSKPIYLTIIGREMAAAVDMAHGVGGTPSLWPGGLMRIPTSDIFGRENETEAIVYWWEAVRGENHQLKAGVINNVVVPLK